MGQIRQSIKRIGPSDLPVLITGESGTGKEVIARTIHAESRRAAQKLVVVDCAAITPTLMESEPLGTSRVPSQALDNHQRYGCGGSWWHALPR